MRVGVVCKAKDKNLYNITYKNHKLYCHRNKIPYALLTPKLSLISFIQNIDYVLYINEHHRFLQINNHISNIIFTKANLLYSKIDNLIDKNLMMISTNTIGQRILNQIILNDTENSLWNQDIEHSKSVEPLPHLFKLSIQKYTEYVGIRSRVFMVDTNGIETQTAALVHKTLNSELGIK